MRFGIRFRKRRARLYPPVGEHDYALEGILMPSIGGYHVLDGVKKIYDNGASEKMTGSAWVPRENVFYVEKDPA